MTSRSSVRSSVGSSAGCSAARSISSGRRLRPTLPDGTYNVTATAMDIAGTASAASSPHDGRHRHPGAAGAQVTGISPDTGRAAPTASPRRTT